MNLLKNSCCLLLLLVLACTKQDETYTKLENLASQYGQRIDNKRAVVMTGLDGCGACVESTIHFIEKNIDNKAIFFVVTGSSKKELRLRFSRKVIRSSNFIFDNQLISIEQDLIKTIHPKVFHLNEKQVGFSKDVVYTEADSIFSKVLLYANTKK